MHFVELKMQFVGLNCTMFKENPLKMSEFLKNNYFFNEKTPSYYLISEEIDFLKGKCPSFA
jgi:hypothetical protein